jgi:hypothetical protein
MGHSLTHSQCEPDAKMHAKDRERESKEEVKNKRKYFSNQKLCFSDRISWVVFINV